MKTRSRVIFLSVLAIACCMSLIAGATFALFTSESEVNFAATAGIVKVVASVDTENAHVYSAKEDEEGDLTDENGYKYSYEEQTNLTFKNGGTATFTGNKVTLSRITPGDKVTFPIKVINNDNVTAKYRTYAQCISGPALFQGLKVTISDEAFSLSDGTMTSYNVYSDWAVIEAPEADGSVIKTVNITVEFPITAGNQYQGLSTAILYGVEAIQGNAHTEDFSTSKFIFYDNMNEGIKGTANASEEDPEKGVVILKDEFAAVCTTVPDVNVGEEYKLKAVVSDSNTAKTFTLQGVNSTDTTKPIEQITYDIKVVDKDGNEIDKHDNSDIIVNLYAGLGIDFVAVFHHVEKDDGSIETIQVAGMDEYDQETGYVSFFTNSFSDYSVVKSFAPVVIIDSELNVKLYTSIQEAIDDAEGDEVITINYLLNENEEVVIDKPVTIKTAENGVKDEEGNVVSPIVNKDGDNLVWVTDVEFIVNPEIVDVVFDIDIKEGEEEVKHCEEHTFVSEIKDGYVTYTCSECGLSYTKKFDKESTCTHDATLTHLSWVDKEVSCTEGANEFVRCGACGSVIINFVEPIGHEFGSNNTCIHVCNGETCGAGSFMVGDDNYTTLKDAATAANNGGTVTLINPEFKGNGVITGVSNVTFDMNGNSFVSNGAYAFTLYDCDGVTIKNGNVNAGNTAFRIGEHTYTIIKWKYADQYPLYGYQPLAPAQNVELNNLTVDAKYVLDYVNINDDLTRGLLSNYCDNDLYGRYIYKTGYTTYEQSVYAKYDEVFTATGYTDTVTVNGGTYKGLLTTEVKNNNLENYKYIGRMVNKDGVLYSQVLSINDGTFSDDFAGRFLNGGKYLVGSKQDETKSFVVGNSASESYMAKINNNYYDYVGGADDAIKYSNMGETIYIKESATAEKYFEKDEFLFVIFEVDGATYTGAKTDDKYTLKSEEMQDVTGGIKFYSVYEPAVAVYATGQGGNWKTATKVDDYPSLKDALSGLQNNYTIVILKDFTVGDEMNYSYGGGNYKCALGYASRSTIDFNGHMITYTGAGSCIVTSQQGGYLYIRDTSTEKTGGITATNGSCFTKLNAKSDYTNIYDVNFIAEKGYALQLVGGTGITINSGRYISKNQVSKGWSVKTLTISGGTFNYAPNANYIASGKTAVDNGNGTWTVKTAA